MIPAGAIRKRAIIRQFLEAGAVSEETARTPEEAGAVSEETARTPEEAGVFRGLGLKFDQLVERGVLVPCAGGRYYVDQCKSG